MNKFERNNTRVYKQSDKYNKLNARKIHNFLTPYEVFFNTRINLIS